MSVPPSPPDPGAEPPATPEPGTGTPPAASAEPAPLAPLWPTSPPPRGPVDTPGAGYGETSAPPHDAHRGYLAETYPAQGFGAQPEDPPAPWQQGPGPYGGPFPGAPGPQPYPGSGHPGPQPYPSPASTGPYGGASGGPWHAGGPVPYGTPAYGWAAPPPPYDGLAIASMITGILGLATCFGVVVGPVAVGLGIAALRRMPQRGTRGRGLAITGVVTGAVCTLVLLVFVLSLAADPQAFLG